MKSIVLGVIVCDVMAKTFTQAAVRYCKQRTAKTGL